MVNIFVHSDLKERFDYLLDGRTLSRWSKGLGISSVRNQIRDGITPGSAPLTTIMRVENVSLSWLVDGKGEPFLHHHCDSDAEAAEYLLALLDEDWTVYVITDGDRLALVLTQPGVLESKDSTQPYTVIEVITGPLGEKTLERVSSLDAESCPVVRITADQMTALGHGEYGTWRLLDSDNALLRRAVPASLSQCLPKPRHAVNESAGNYNKAELRILEAFRGMPEKKQHALLELLDD